jgi:hypothetical protein
LIVANRMPNRSVLREMCNNDAELQKTLENAKLELSNLFEQIDELRRLLHLSASKESDFNQLESNNFGLDFQDSWNHLGNSMKVSRKRHFDVMDKWSLKTQLAQGKLSKSKGNNGLKTLNQSLSKQILASMEDKERLLQRAHTARIHYASLTEDSKIDEQIPQKKSINMQIYDDTDFYHRLLKEMMAAGSGTVVGAEYDQITDSISEASAASKQRKLNTKDMKSSKGRRIRYTVESKLVNFMAPEPLKGDMGQISSDLFLTLYKNMTNQAKKC